MHFGLRIWVTSLLLTANSLAGFDESCWIKLALPEGDPIAHVKVGVVNDQLSGRHQLTTFYVQMGTNLRFRSSWQVQHLLDRESVDPGHLQRQQETDFVGITRRQATLWNIRTNDLVQLVLEAPDGYRSVTVKALVQEVLVNPEELTSAMDQLQHRLAVIFDFNALPFDTEQGGDRIALSRSSLKTLDLERTPHDELASLTFSLYRLTER